MSGMDDREKGYENKYAHDQELEFKAMVRRNKKLGLWAADMMGLTGDDADGYAQEVIKSDFEEAGDEDVFRKVRTDFDKHDIEQSDHQIRRQMEELLEQARQEVYSE